MTSQDESHLIGHEACPSCGSKDNLARYDDGHAYCFGVGCGYYEGADGEVKAKYPDPPEKDSRLLDGDTCPLPHRGITQATCQKFGYLTLTMNNKPVEAATYCDMTGKPVAQKVRCVRTKKFMWVGNPKKVGLYGQHLWAKGGKKVVVTEGEIDALSVSQVQDNRWPVVSLPNGAGGARKDLAKQLEWLESFDEVILMFDQDEAGRKAVEECVSLFSPGKVRIAKLPLKDANEMLLARKIQELKDAVWSADVYRPDGILAGDMLWETVQAEPTLGLSYPWQSLTKLTYGIRPNEMYVFGAGTGMGKTEFFKEIAACLLEHGQTIGMIHLEESPRDTALGLMSKKARKLFHLPDGGWTPEEKRKAFLDTLGSGRVFLYDSFGATDYEVIQTRLRYLVVACGCKHVFLDHITALTDGVEDANSVNQKMKNIVSDLASMCRELNFTLFAISHLRKASGTPHEEGGRVHLDDLYGAAALKQWASFVFGLERDQQAEDEEERHTTTFRVLKDRYTGRALGKTIAVKYDQHTGALYEESQAVGAF